MGKKIKKRKAGKWGKGLSGIYQVVNFIHKYKIYKMFKPIPLPFMEGFAHLFSMVFFRKSEKAKRRMKKSIQTLTGVRFSEKKLGRLTDAVMKNMGILLFDVMLKGPNQTSKTMHKLVKFEDIKYLDDALKLGKGAIIVSLHLGQFFHTIGGLAMHPAGYHIAVVANMANQMIFEHLVMLPKFRRLHPIGRDKYRNLKEELYAHLNENHLIFLMHDMSNKRNFKVPFIAGKKNFLVNPPQGAIKLHRESGAPIVPMLSIPNGRFTKSTLKFFDSQKLLEISEQFKEEEDKIIHGELAIAINKMLYPYMIKYIHCNEELTGIGSRVFNVKIKLPKELTLQNIIEKIQKWVIELIENSYEPERNDEKLIEEIMSIFNIYNSILKENQSKRGKRVLKHNGIIRLGGMEPRAQIKKLLLIINLLLRERASINFETSTINKKIAHVLGCWS